MSFDWNFSCLQSPTSVYLSQLLFSNVIYVLNECIFFQIMASDVLRVKLRIQNNIYNVMMSPSSLTDVLLKGLNSSTVKTVMRGAHEGVVTGQFANPVEVLSAINQSDISTGKDEEVMEFEVSILLFHVYLFVKFLAGKIFKGYLCFVPDYSCSACRAG